MPVVEKKRRIGLFGGAFDPPHLAHEALVKTAISELALDRLLVVPTGRAWHKPRELTPAVHRLAMTQLAFAHCPQVTVDAQEIERSGPSYTIDTLRVVAASEPDAQLFLIMGGDQANTLTTWHDWQEILQLATICVAFRADSTKGSTLFESEKMVSQRFIQLNMPAMPLSATQIRASLSAGQTANTLVSEAVARYIADHHLYQSN
ncbi:MAG: nicotinate-nucleotide adenylyltransferase [Comamonadaceae bacterium]|nr:MAG: nicotinate-nucleotide adenylyltransferase [Comamonadaceae bacterium]